jgi:hypothetical protein
MDEEARQQTERTNRFIAEFRELIASTVVDPASPSRLPAIAGLERIATTVDAVDYVTFCNLANLNAAMRGILLDVLKVKLMCVGQGPTLDYADASAFLAESSADIRPMEETAPALKLNR